MLLKLLVKMHNAEIDFLSIHNACHLVSVFWICDHLVAPLL